MGKIISGADRDRVTVNTNNVWDRIVALEESGLSKATKDEVDVLENTVEQLSTDLTQTATLDKDFPRIAGEITDSPRIQRAIDAIKTTTTGWQLEAIKGNINSKKKIILPASRLIISQTINLPSYINFEGAGRHTTILESAITDGSPVILLDGNDVTQTHNFYTTIKGFSIDGNNLNCQGIKFNFAHRWLLDDVYIGSTRAEGLYFWESYLGDVRSVYVWACGNVGKPAVKLDGSDFDNASHGINFFGGEIVGSLDHGFYSHYGASISIFGTTIEGNTKAGIVLDNTLSTLITGCYLEENVNHIEVIRSEGATIKGNYFSSLKAESLGNIGITKLYGSEISSNTFANALSGGQYNLFAIGLDIDLRFRSSHVLNNTAAILPIAIETRLLTLAKTSGSLIETDNLVQRQIHGKPNYNDGLSSNGVITSSDDISSTKSFTVNGTNMLSGNSDPVGVLTANQGSLYMRSSGSTPLYGKIGGGTGGWRAVQISLGGDTASRPTGVPLAFMYFDQTIQKPIWWNGTVWKDSTGTIV